MKTLKFSVKRKVSGKVIRKLKRRDKFLESHTWKDSFGVLHTTYYTKHRGSKVTYRSYSVRREKTIYELEEKAPRQAGLDYTNWEAHRLIIKYKKEGKKGKLKRLYKAYPTYSPEYKRQREHEKEVALWKEKLQKNHENQIQCRK